MPHLVRVRVRVRARVRVRVRDRDRGRDRGRDRAASACRKSSVARHSRRYSQRRLASSAWASSALARLVRGRVGVRGWGWNRGQSEGLG